MSVNFLAMTHLIMTGLRTVLDVLTLSLIKLRYIRSTTEYKATGNNGLAVGASDPRTHAMAR
jgi:hypothetical protein